VTVVSTASPLVWDARVEGRRMFLYTNGGVDAGVRIGWHPAPDGDIISIMFGNEQIALDFHDVESLERLRDVADQAASWLRTELEGVRDGSR
jgi:hypothetical protein